MISFKGNISVCKVVGTSCCCALHSSYQCCLSRYVSGVRTLCSE